MIPGEGSQAKRRAAAVIVDHLIPAMTRAEIHGGLAELETLIDEYYVAAGIDERRRAHLEGEILAVAERHGLDRDLGIGRDDRSRALRSLDAHLCELKEMQIRDGLHTLGVSPTARQRIDTLVAIARVPRSGGRPADQSLHRAIAADLGLAFDPLDCDLAAAWAGPRPAVLGALSDAPWRTAGDTVERVEALAARLVEAWSVRHRRRLHRLAGAGPADLGGPDWIVHELAPALDGSGAAEIAAVLTALDGRFVSPGPSGAPTRGRPDALPTGRNFYSVDVRAVPTEAAWTLGRAAADAMALRYFQDAGEWPRAIALSAWGTSNMRTGGDDIAQVLAFIGAMPVWEAGTGRVTGFNDHSAVATRPAAHRRDAEDLRHVPRRLSGPARSHRFRDPGGRRARRRRRRQSDRRRGPRRRRRGFWPRAPIPCSPHARRRRASSAPSPAPTAPACRP